MMRIGIIFFLMLSSLMIFSCGDLFSDSTGGSVSVSISNTNNGSGLAILLTTPTNGDDTVIYTPTLAWTNSESATPTSYTIRWATDSSFKQNNVEKTIQGDQTSYTIPTSEKLLSGTTYYWFVLSSSGKKSETQSFRTASANAPVITFVSPVNTESDVPIRPKLTLKWTSQNVPAGSTYTLAWGTDNPPTNGKTTTQALSSIIQQTSRQTKGKLDQNTTYYWQVTASDGTASKVFQFTTEKIIPTAPTGLTVAAQSGFIENIDVSWTATSGYATEYEVYYEGVRQKNGISGTQSTLPVGLKETREITVVAKNSAGSSPASTVYQHTNALCTTTADDIKDIAIWVDYTANAAPNPYPVRRGFRKNEGGQPHGGGHKPLWLTPDAVTPLSQYTTYEAGATVADFKVNQLKARDTDGDSITFSIVDQTPDSPSWVVTGSTGAALVPQGLDFETANAFYIRFGVRDGSTTVNSHYEEAFAVNNIEELQVDFSSRSSASGASQSDGSLVINVISVSSGQVPVYFIVSKDGKELYSKENYPAAAALGKATLWGLAPGRYSVDVIDSYGYTGLIDGAYSVYDHGHFERSESVDGPGDKNPGLVSAVNAKYLKDVPIYVCYQ